MDYHFKGAFENMFAYYEQEIVRGRELMYKMKKSIEGLIEADEEVSKHYQLQ